MTGLSRATHLRVIAVHMANAEPDEPSACPRFIRQSRDDRFWWLPWLCGAALFALIWWGIA